MEGLENVKMRLSTALDDLEWLGLDPILRLKSNRPFAMDEQGKPMFYMDTGETVPEDDIVVKEENPFWKFAHRMAEIDKEYTVDDMQARGIFKPEVNEAVCRRIREKDFKLKSQKDLEILWMYFCNKKWVVNNQSAFILAMMDSGRFEKVRGESKKPGDICMNYVRKALRDDYKKYGFCVESGDDYVVLKGFYTQWRLNKGQGTGYPSKYRRWIRIIKAIEDTFEHLEVGT